MGIVKSNLAISLDGFSSAPGQSREEPFGQGGGRLTEWMFETDLPGREADAKIRGTWSDGVGAFVMGRHMFGGYAGDWDLSWRGWWGEDPPYHAPVYVLTHHERAPLPMQGGTTFHFVTDGIESALKQAQAAAGDRRWRSRAARPPCGSTSRRASSTSCWCTSYPWCWRRRAALGRARRPGRRADRGDRLPDRHPRALPRRHLTVGGDRRDSPW